jgi:hypothetical protein
MRYQKRACSRRLFSPPRGLLEDWPSGTLPARQPEGEMRAQATLVDALLHAPADVGSIPTVSIVMLLGPLSRLLRSRDDRVRRQLEVAGELTGRAGAGVPWLDRVRRLADEGRHRGPDRRAAGLGPDRVAPAVHAVAEEGGDADGWAAGDARIRRGERERAVDRVGDAGALREGARTAGQLEAEQARPRGRPRSSCGRWRCRRTR